MKGRPFSTVVLVILCGNWAESCHILELTEEGFGGNFLHLLHAVAIYESSGGGAFMVDHSRFPFRCDDSSSGGITDFFNHTGIIPWTKEAQVKAEAVEKHPCKRIDFLSLDHQVVIQQGGEPWPLTLAGQVSIYLSVVHR